jgi:GNAT superfamily N-acetyltransferase
VTVHRKLLSGLDRLNATSIVLQRARPLSLDNGIWDAADVQWWWRRPRVSDDFTLPVWFDEFGPVAAVGITAWESTWQTDPFVVPNLVSRVEVWEETMAAVAEYGCDSLQILLPEKDSELTNLALSSGFALSDEISGTTWMHIDDRPSIPSVDGYKVVDRTNGLRHSHHMVKRNGDEVESRLKQCSLYDPTLDLVVLDDHENVAGYALFWFDQSNHIGMLEPMRVEEGHQRKGLAKLLIASGLERLAVKGARRVKVGFESEAASSLYFSMGFKQTSVDRLLTRSSEK